MHNTLDWKSSEDTRDIVHIVVQALVEGRRVALPAETAYHAVFSGLNPAGVEHIRTLEKSNKISDCCLLIRSSQELLDYIPDLSSVAARVARRAWPGPLVLNLPICSERSLLGRLPTEVQNLLVRDGRAAFRVASHDTVRQALRLMPGPLLAAPLTHQDGPARTADAIEGSAGFAIVVDDGQTQFSDFATHVRIDGNQCQVLRKGVLQEESLTRSAQFVVLVVCTGNTCRSPMAEAIMRDMFAKRFGGAEQAAQKVFVASAGLNAFPGGQASSEAQTVMTERGLSLQDHQSRSVTAHGLQNADLILTMTKSHRSAILDQIPDIESKVHLVSGARSDVSDPFGGSKAIYSACADQIDGLLGQWMDRLDDSLFPTWL
jgi:protein-tyrosine-phosphatase/tRNA A37 threonylcarbamoyladenosine synthetase subunit TsaC/SUA5/YrdC